MTNVQSRWDHLFSRRRFLQECGLGIGSLALTHILHTEGLLAGEPVPAVQGRAMVLRPKPSHFPARVKAVIHLVQDGGPSQVDTFDHKPVLEKYAGQPLPADKKFINSGGRKVGFLTPGQTKLTGNLNTVRTCGFHDHDQSENRNLQGTIVIQ